MKNHENHENHKNILKIARTSNPAKGSYNEDRSSSTLDVNLAQNIVCRRPVPDISFLSCFHFLMILYDFAQNREHRENRENHENHENIFMIFMIFKTCRGPVLDTKRARPTKSRGPVLIICPVQYFKNSNFL